MAGPHLPGGLIPGMARGARREGHRGAVCPQPRRPLVLAAGPEWALLGAHRGTRPSSGKGSGRLLCPQRPSPSPPPPRNLSCRFTGHEKAAPARGCRRPCPPHPGDSSRDPGRVRNARISWPPFSRQGQNLGPSFQGRTKQFGFLGKREVWGGARPRAVTATAGGAACQVSPTPPGAGPPQPPPAAALNKGGGARDQAEKEMRETATLSPGGGVRVLPLVSVSVSSARVSLRCGILPSASPLCLAWSCPDGGTNAPRPSVPRGSRCHFLPLSI